MAYKQKERKNPWLGFFNYYLDAEEKAGIRTLVDDKKRPSVRDVVGELVKHNYKVSISENESSGGFICAVTGKSGNPNAGYTYTLTHMEVEVAIYAAWFVVSTIFQWEEWPVDENEVPNW